MLFQPLQTPSPPVTLHQQNVSTRGFESLDPRWGNGKEFGVSFPAARLPPPHRPCRDGAPPGKPVPGSQTRSLGCGCSHPPREKSHKPGRKLSGALPKFRVCRREMRLVGAARPSGVPGSPHGGSPAPERTEGNTSTERRSGAGASHGAQPAQEEKHGGFGGRIRRDGTKSRGLAGDVASAGAAAWQEHRPHVVVTTARCRRARGAEGAGILCRGSRRRAGAGRVAPSLVCLQAN